MRAHILTPRYTLSLGEAMPDERDLIRNFHTAVQRYVIERMSSFDAYLKPESGGVWSITAKMDDSNTFMEVFPRIHFLNSLRWDIGRISLETLKTLDQLRTLLDTVAQSCLAFTLGGKPAENAPPADTATDGFSGGEDEDMPMTPSFPDDKVPF